MSNDTNQHGLTDDELGGRLRRAAWGLFLIGPLGALIGGEEQTQTSRRHLTASGAVASAPGFRRPPLLLAKVPRFLSDQFRGLVVPIPSGC